MLKHCVVKGRHVMKPLHVCLIVLQYYTRVATGRAGYVLYRALVMFCNLSIKLRISHLKLSVIGARPNGMNLMTNLLENNSEVDSFHDEVTFSEVEITQPVLQHWYTSGETESMENSTHQSRM